MVGDVVLGEADDFYDGRGGSVLGLVHGGNGSDVLRGGAGNEMLLGEDGLDTLFGGAGVGADRLDDAVFGGLALGDLAADAFASNLTGRAGDATDRIILETDTGVLWFDPEGRGGVARVAFASIGPGVAIAAGDITAI